VLAGLVAALCCGCHGGAAATATTAPPTAATARTVTATATATATARATGTASGSALTTATHPRRFAPATTGPRDLALVFTASVQGYVEPCGCTAEPLGGIARLGAVLHEARAAFGERVLFVDGGDLLFEKADDHAPADRCQAEARTDLLVGTYARLGLAATTRGPLDEVRGAPFRQRLLQRHGVVSVDDGAGIVVTRGGLRVLVIGVDARTPASTVQSTVDTHAGVDLVVVLAQLPRAQAKAQASLWRGVDLVVVGRAGEAPVAPERAGSAVVVDAGWQSQHAGVVVARLADRVAGQALALDDRAVVAAARRKVLDVRIAQADEALATLPAGAQRDFQAQRRAAFVTERDALGAVDDATALPPLPGPHVAVHALPLRRGDAEDDVAARGLADYVRAIPTLVAACERDVTCPAPPDGVATYVGATTCRACHAAAYEHWQQALATLPATAADGTKHTRPVGHARAWTTLVDAGRDRDRSCVGCHATGFLAPGGACTTTKLVERDLTGVQCEACHGPGSLHVAGGGDKAQIRRDVDESTCRGCHVPPHIESAASFVLSERLQIILGPGHGAARRQQLAPPASRTATP
jgi:hypothetical protein